jgi:hypothetical protein
MRKGGSRLRYRSWVRVSTWTLLGLLFTVGGVGGVDGGNPAAVVFAGLGLVVVAFAWWPRLVVTGDGVVIRNLTSTRLAWRDVAAIRVKPQLPYLGPGWRRIDAFSRASRGPGLGAQEYPGLVINTHSQGPIVFVALQRSVIFTRPGIAERVAAELIAARQAAAKHRDPVEAVRMLRAGRRLGD